MDAEYITDDGEDTKHQIAEFTLGSGDTKTPIRVLSTIGGREGSVLHNAAKFMSLQHTPEKGTIPLCFECPNCRNAIPTDFVVDYFRWLKKLDPTTMSITGHFFDELKSEVKWNESEPEQFQRRMNSTFIPLFYNNFSMNSNQTRMSDVLSGGAALVTGGITSIPQSARIYSRIGASAPMTVRLGLTGIFAITSAGVVAIPTYFITQTLFSMGSMYIKFWKNLTASLHHDIGARAAVGIYDKTVMEVRQEYNLSHAAADNVKDNVKQEPLSQL